MSDKRKIFEEVRANVKPPEVPRGGVIDSAQRGDRHLTRLWLIVLFAMVVLMIAVGGLTRLTDSGLSITEWRPVTGALPPMSAEAWQAEFDKYKEIPEYTLQNEGMTLSEFKFIYWWEWGHRQLGRLIGLVWAVGFLGLLVTRKIPTGWIGRLALLGALGGLQGAIGWWMVSSGLEGTMLDVASYRLATHLGLAFVILGLIAWFVFRLGRSEVDLLQARRAQEPGLFAIASGLMYLAFLQILLGALVAGIDAGRTYNEWPLMAGQFFPANALDLTPVWRNFFENAGLVQFLHRLAGYFLFAFIIFAFVRSQSSGNWMTKTTFALVLAMATLQMLLGIMTVLYMAPLWLALLHQLGAVALWTLILRARFLSNYPTRQSVRG